MDFPPIKSKKQSPFAPESLAMVLAKFTPDRSTPIESESHSPMKNTAKTTSSAFFKLNLQINDLQSPLPFRVLQRKNDMTQSRFSLDITGFLWFIPHKHAVAFLAVGMIEFHRIEAPLD